MQLAASVYKQQPVFAIVNARSWEPTEAEFERALGHIHDKAYVARIRRFHKGFASAAECPHHEMDDPKCFVLGRALYTVAFGAKAASLRCPSTSIDGGGRAYPIDADVELRRTAEERPHIGHLGTWYNGNVSHAGGVVAFAATDIPGFVVGCDVMPIELAPPEPISDASVREFFALFRDYFTLTEWGWIRSPVDVAAAGKAVQDPQRSQLTPISASSGPDATFAAFFMLKRFLTLWTLKEALIKAMGIGLGFELQRASFAPSRIDVWASDFYTASTDVAVELDGRPAPTWAFNLSERADWNCIFATAVAPVCFAGESSFLRTFDGAIAKSGVSGPPPSQVCQACSAAMHKPLVVMPEELLEAAAGTG